MDTYDAPKRTAALYAPDGVLWGTEVHAPDDPLWGTVSEEVRDSPERIYAYYVRARGGQCCDRSAHVCCHSHMFCAVARLRWFDGR